MMFGYEKRRYHGEFQLREFNVLISAIESFMGKVQSLLKRNHWTQVRSPTTGEWLNSDVQQLQEDLQSLQLWESTWRQWSLDYPAIN